MDARHIQGRCASPGFAAGIVQTFVDVGRASIADLSVGTAQEETEALRAAIAKAITDLKALSDGLDDDAAAILHVQLAFLEDEALSEGAFAAIGAGVSAADAWRRALAQEIAGYEEAEDEYFRARASDLRDLRDRVLEVLTGHAAMGTENGAILYADDLSPSRFLSGHWQGGAILLRQGSPKSHVAMLARARAIPMIVGLGEAELAGHRVLINASEGRIIIDPQPDEQGTFDQAVQASQTSFAQARSFLLRPAVTIDGTTISTLINVADPTELDALDPAICDGIGLVRTELLFEGQNLPDEEQQLAAYARVLAWAAGRPVTIRTLDAGGDKPIAGLTPKDESNPFLGVRGVRLTLKRPDVFLPQLRALARAAALGPLEVMIPMVTLPQEMAACRSLMADACAALAQERLAHRFPPLGMMVEVPAAALTIDLFAADFLSIGSNDLTQYVMAAGRDIEAVSDLADPTHEAVLRLIAIITDHARRTGKKLSLCGDAGGEPRHIPALLRHGMRALSMAPHLLAGAKRAIAEIRLGERDV